MPGQFGQQEYDANGKYHQGQPAMVVFFAAMVEGIGAHGKSKRHHAVFEAGIFNNIYSKQGHAGQKKGQQCAVNGASHRSGYTECVPIDLAVHPTKL